MCKIPNDKNEDIMSEKKKKGKKGIAGKIVTYFLLLVVIATVFLAIANYVCRNKLIKYAGQYIQPQSDITAVFEKDEAGTAYTVTDRDLKILDLTDVKIYSGILTQDEDKAAIDKIYETIMAEKPDLVIISGDLAYPDFTTSGTFNNRYGTSVITALFENLNVYYAPAFADKCSDLFSLCDAQSIAEMYLEECLEHSLYRQTKNQYTVYVLSPEGIVTETISLNGPDVHSDLFYFLNKKNKTDMASPKWSIKTSR